MNIETQIKQAFDELNENMGKQWEEFHFKMGVYKYVPIVSGIGKMLSDLLVVGYSIAIIKEKEAIKIDLTKTKLNGRYSLMMSQPDRFIQRELYGCRNVPLGAYTGFGKEGILDSQEVMKSLKYYFSLMPFIEKHLPKTLELIFGPYDEKMKRLAYERILDEENFDLMQASAEDYEKRKKSLEERMDYLKKEFPGYI